MNLSQKAIEYFNSPAWQTILKKYGQKYAPDIIEKINSSGWKLDSNQITHLLGYLNWFNIKSFLLNPRAAIWALAYPQAKKVWKFAFIKFRKQIIIWCLVFLILLAGLIFLIVQIVNYLINLWK